MDRIMKRRWISIYVENEIGMLAKISGLFSSKSYNIDTITVGETQDATISRMTIGLTIDDMTFEQIIKQLNRCVGVIKVIDITDARIHMKELLFLKIRGCSEEDRTEIYRIAQAFDLKVIDYDKNTVILECVKTEERNNDIIRLMRSTFGGKIEIVRGGSVAIEAVSICDR